MNKYGYKIAVSIEGESHSNTLKIAIDGIKANEEINIKEIAAELESRRPSQFFNTARVEKDEFNIISGVENSKTNGQTIIIEVKNNKQSSKAYDEHEGFLRPGHADYTRYVKQNKNQISSGGGTSSGRMTVLLVAAGSIAKQILKNKYNIQFVSHIKKACGICDEEFDTKKENKTTDVLPVFSNKIQEMMLEKLQETKNSGDTAGCMIETIILNVAPGVGNPFFNSVESCFSHVLFAIPSVKAVEFGDGADFADKKGSEVVDSFFFDKTENTIKTDKNHNGGINGGITNGMPIIVKTTIKPIPTTQKPLTSYNIDTKKEETVVFGGQHDVFIGNRVVPVIECSLALALLDLIYEEEDKKND